MGNSGYGLVVTAAPSVEPVTLDEAKTYIGVRGSSKDDDIRRQIKAVRLRVEDYLGRKLIHTTMRQSMDAWPTGGLFRPPYSPLSSVSSITYVDGDGDTQTWSSSNYDVDTDMEPGRIAPAYGVTLPTLRGDIAGVKLTYVVGYGDSASDVPDGIRDAILKMLRESYDMPAGVHSVAFPAGLEFYRVSIYG